MSELTPRANIEIARNIIAGLQSNISEMERFWPKSKRGSNAQRIWSAIAEQAAAAVTCLEDATARIAETERMTVTAGDIVDRLRELCTDWDGRQMSRSEEPRVGFRCALLFEAADEIERLQKERDELRSLYEQQGLSAFTVAKEWQARAEAAEPMVHTLKAALAPLVLALTAILAEAPRDSKGSDEFNLFTDCEGNEYCATLDQIRAVVGIAGK